MSESPRDGTLDFVKVLVGLVLLLGFAYGILVVGNVLLSFLPALLVGLVWVLYRLVVAVERIADAQERRARAVEAGAEGAGGGWSRGADDADEPDEVDGTDDADDAAAPTSDVAASDSDESAD
ncbi:hypothetical protein [Halorarum halobium]|uniref:hypothetical protein n=1 Tax=Halorarum halobium TaxID=3075121 RepID=UPI0028A703E5|nr:hypothetical protein [Halobaculum sp. XH14]